MKPSVSTALSEGLSLTWNSFGRFLVPSLILFFSLAVYMSLSIVASVVAEFAPIVGFVLQMFAMLLQGVFVVASAAIFVWFVVRALQVIRSSDSPIFTWGRFGWYLLYQLLLSVASFALSIPIGIVAVVAGIGIGALVASGSLAGAAVLGVIAGLLALALVVVLVYLGVRVTLAPYVIADTSANPIEALKRSWQLSSRRFWPILGISILLGFANAFVGLITVGLGLIFTAPASHVMIAHYYEQLSSVKKSKKA